MTFSILVALSSFLLCLLGTRITILALRQRAAMLALPGEKEKVPTGGGVAVVMALVIGLLVADLPYAVALSVFLLAALSLMDDVIGVPGFVRILVQLLAVLIPLSMMEPVFGLPPLLDKGLVVVLWLWCINLFDLMDGIDGITPTEMIAVGMGLALVVIVADAFPAPLARYGLVLFGVACGFMWWNWYPAKIKLGEVGTVPVGFVVGYLLLLAVREGYGYAAAILPAYYFSDATITMLYRVSKGKQAFRRHSEYYYRAAMSKGRRADTVTRYVFGLNMLLILLATFTVIDEELAIFYVGLAYMAVFMILGFFAYSPHNPRHEPF